MIQGLEGLQQTISQLEGSQIKLYLTGSRFFGNSNPGSDWDFFTESSQEAEFALTLMGFSVLDHPDDYGYDELDTNTTKIYRKSFSDGNHIDVQLSKNVLLKATAQNLIKKHNMVYMLSKTRRDIRQNIWNLIYEAIQTVIDDQMPF